MLIRVFALFALLLCYAYFADGMSLMIRLVSGALSSQARVLGLQLIAIPLDFLVGIALMIVGIGLLFLKEWARKTWPIVMSALTAIHFAMIAITVFVGLSVSGSYLIWTAMIVVMTAISWWYFMRQSLRKRFAIK